SNSGDYEKFFFTKDTNTLRSHIINASTGFSDNFHRSAIVFSDTYSYVLDVLSTTLMNLETIDEIEEMVKRFEDFYKTSIAYCIIDDFENGFKLSVNEKFNDCIVENKISSIIKDIQVIKN
ncbi:MAG: FAD:protein FMN transferase, partial [Bacilli bacterium]